VGAENLDGGVPKRTAIKLSGSANERRDVKTIFGERDSKRGST